MTAIRWVKLTIVNPTRRTFWRRLYESLHAAQFAFRQAWRPM